MEQFGYNDVLKKYLDEKKNDIIRDVCELVKIGSVSDDPLKVNDALEYVLSLARSFGFKASAVLGGQAGVVEIGAGDETLGILSHVDVVGPGDMAQWHSKPFEPVVRDGKIFGRGTLDDKGPLIVCLYAMKAVCELGLPLTKKVQLILGTQEEVEWTDMKAYVEEFPLPDYGFTPDGEFPVCNIEKGAMDIALSFPIDPPDRIPVDGKYLTGLDAGTASNVVPGVCTAEIEEYLDGRTKRTALKVQGKAVHSCQPEKGDNAIFKMAELLGTMELSKNRIYTLLKMINEKLSDIYGKELGLYSSSEYYRGEFVHRNVFSPTMFKIEDGAAKININVRFPYGADENGILKAFQEIAEDHGGDSRLEEYLPAVYVSKDKPFVTAFADAYDEVSGRKNEFVLAYGGSYAKAMPNIVSWGPVFPDDEDTCHEENEYISIESLMDNAKIFAAAIAKIVLSSKSFK
jgi:succinyl-diaminopimelate desuccinylase